MATRHDAPSHASLTTVLPTTTEPWSFRFHRSFTVTKPYTQAHAQVKKKRGGGCLLGTTPIRRGGLDSPQPSVTTNSGHASVGRCHRIRSGEVPFDITAIAKRDRDHPPKALCLRSTDGHDSDNEAHRSPRPKAWYGRYYVQRR